MGLSCCGVAGHCAWAAQLMQKGLSKAVAVGLRGLGPAPEAAAGALARQGAGTLAHASGGARAPTLVAADLGAAAKEELPRERTAAPFSKRMVISLAWVEVACRQFGWVGGWRRRRQRMFRHVRELTTSTRLGAWQPGSPETAQGGQENEL